MDEYSRIIIEEYYMMQLSQLISREKNADLQEALEDLYEILYLIFDYPHKHYTFKHFEI